MPEQVLNTLIIGAGVSGLSVAAELKKRSVDFRIIESASRIGGSWHKRHPQLRLNTYRNYSAMPRSQYKPGVKSYPTRDDVIEHLNDFAAVENLKIELGIKAVAIKEIKNNVIAIKTNRETIYAHHVVFGTGLDFIPKKCAIKGLEHFAGDVIHSRDLGSVENYSGKRVIVIGAGNSGFDVLNHLVRSSATEIYFAVRGMSPVLPKRFMGVTTHLFAPFTSALPARLSGAIISLIEFLAFGNLRKLGFPVPEQNGAMRLNNGKAIAVDDGAINAIKEGRIKIIPKVASFDKHGVVLENGDRLDLDVVIHANGYLPGAIHIDGISEYLDDNSKPITDKYGMSQFNSRIWFVAHYPSMIGFFHTAALQAVRISETVKNSVLTDEDQLSQ